MYYMIRSSVMFRNFKSFGYITDNRNFGYKRVGKNKENIGDKIVSQTGAVFLSALCQKPQTLDDIAQKLISQFNDVDIETILIDAKEFYGVLEQDGFIVSGETIRECDNNNVKFSYKISTPTADDNSFYTTNNVINKDTDVFINDFFNKKPQLKSLHLEITSKCNERCVHCYLPNNTKTNHIETGLLYRILEQCNEINLLHLTLTGGEPMMHPDFTNLLKECNNYNLSVNVLSNLTLLNDNILEEMKKNSLLSVQVSLYSMDANIHDTITQTEGSFELTKKSIFKLLKNDIPIQISCPIIKQNINTYKDVLSWAKRHKIHAGCDYVIIGKCDYTTQNLANRLSIDDIKKIIKYKVNNEPDYFDKIINESEIKKNDTPDDIVCTVCQSSLCISENGNVYPCAGWQGRIVGNVNETSLKDIWNNSPDIQYLRHLRKRNFPKCSQCPERYFCTMCMVRNANEHPLGDPLVVNDFFCEVAKIYKNIALHGK